MRLSEPLRELSLWRSLKIRSHDNWDNYQFKVQRQRVETTSKVDICVEVWGKATESLFVVSRCPQQRADRQPWNTSVLTAAGREAQNSWHRFSTYIDNVACWAIYWRDKEPHKSPYYHLGDIYSTYKHTLRQTRCWSYEKDNLLC